MKFIFVYILLTISGVKSLNKFFEEERVLKYPVEDKANHLNSIEDTSYISKQLRECVDFSFIDIKFISWKNIPSEN